MRSAPSVTVNAQYALVTMAYERKLIELTLFGTFTTSVFYKDHVVLGQAR